MDKAEDTPLRRLGKLGLSLPTPVPPVGAYASVTRARAGDLVFTSGQVPLDNGRLIAVGRLGGEVSTAVGRACARQCALNALAAVDAALGGLASVTGVVKATVYIAATTAFADHPEVADGATDLLIAVLGESARPARSAVGVTSLPLGAPVELELILTTA